MTAKKTKEKRPNRIPVGANRDVLTVTGIPDGYVARWVNDVDNRIAKFLDAGYEFIEDNGELVIGQDTVDSSDSVGSRKSKNVGNGVTAYLMAIRKDWYNEDQAEKAEITDKSEADMLRKLNDGADGRYGNVEINK